LQTRRGLKITVNPVRLFFTRLTRTKTLTQWWDKGGI